MKALLCREYGGLDQLKVEEVPALVAGAGQIVVAVKYASVNFPDALIVQGKYQFKPNLPFTPGSEVAGVVKSIGAGVTKVKVGQNVLVLPGRGGFAEEVIAGEAQVTPLAAGIDLAAAAGMPMTYGTCYHALKDRGQLKAGETLLVLGAGGGIGIAGVELGKLMGATVIAAASSDEKLQAAKSRGADHLINYAAQDLRTRLKEIVGEKGVDVVLDPVGGSYAEPALRSTGWNGRFLVIGFAAGEIPKIPINLPLLKGNSIVGVFWGDFMKRQPADGQAQMSQLVAWLAEGKIKPLISQQFKLSDAKSALDAVFTRKATGKIVVVPG
jgi:NADPH2:quinone reductase